MIRPDQLKREIDNLIARFPELADDPELFADTLEGETAFDAVMGNLIRADMEARAMADAIATQATALAERKKRIGRRSEAARSMMQSLMELTGQKKIELPEATISLRNVAQGVVIADEEAIPADYLVYKVTPDRKAIAEALKAGTEVDGATLGNGGVTVVVKYT